ncbi:MAG: hypothetical protein HXS52_01065 [Theionarchaea archaeon]|nr:hypothetical protein [Theionarchaea archaeon]MBU7036494.1 hypothetical protein [Theionarchaea archaeon]
MATESRRRFTFPVGYHEFHRDQVFNFQLNRWYSLGYTRFEDLKEAVSSRILEFRKGPRLHNLSLIRKRTL